MGVVVDTSVLIAIERARLRGLPRHVLSEFLPSDSWISAITAMELRVGALLSDVPRRAARVQFLEDTLALCPTLPFAEREAEQAAQFFAFLRRAGRRIGERDLMIAATAVANGHSVMTLNRSEFERVPGLTLLAAPDVRLP